MVLKVWLLLLTVLVVLPFTIWIYTKAHVSFRHSSSDISLTNIFIFVFRVLIFQSIQHFEIIPRIS